MRPLPHPVTSPFATAEWLVACLCAAWCGTCREFEKAFHDAPLPAVSRRAWLDVEEQEAVVGTVDPETFPTLLIARGRDVFYFGSVEPRMDRVAALLDRAMRGALEPVRAVEASALAIRAGAWCAR